MLTGDPIEAIEQARLFRRRTLSSLLRPDTIGALGWSSRRRTGQGWDDDRTGKYLQDRSDVVEDLGRHDRAASGREIRGTVDRRRKVVPPQRRIWASRLCVPGLGKTSTRVPPCGGGREGAKASTLASDRAMAVIESDEAVRSPCHVENARKPGSTMPRGVFQEGAGGADHRAPVVRHGRIGRGLDQHQVDRPRSLKRRSTH